MKTTIDDVKEMSSAITQKGKGSSTRQIKNCITFQFVT